MLAREWIRARYPYGTVFERQCLGPITTSLNPDDLSQEELAMVRGRRPRVRFLAIADHKLILVEGAAKLAWDKVLRMAELKALVLQTPELTNERDYTLLAILCCLTHTARAANMARQKGILIQTPQFIWECPDPSPTYTIDQPLGDIESGAAASDTAADSASDTD